MGKRSLKPATPAPDVDEELGEASEDDGFVAGDFGQDDDRWDDDDEADDLGFEEPAEAPSEAGPDGDVSAGDTEIAGDGETTGSPLASSGADVYIAPSDDDTIIPIPLEFIVPDPDQPRLEVDDELAASIKLQGVLQPITVRVNLNPLQDEQYMIEDGERRWRGAKAAGLTTIRARVNRANLDAGDRLLRQVTLNDGKRLTAMEEAKAWKRILDAKGWTIQQLAAVLGRAKSTVSDRLAMLNAPKPFQPLFASGVLTPAAAPIVRALSDVPERFLVAMVEELSANEWRDFVSTAAPLPLQYVHESLGSNTGVCYSIGLRRLDHLADGARTLYEGETVKIGGKTFATDAQAYDKASHDYYYAPRGESGPGDAARFRAENERREREAAERKKQKDKQRRIRAQFDAVAAKLPRSIGAVSGKDNEAWVYVVLDLVIREVHQDTLRVLAGHLKLTADKSRVGGLPRYGEAIKKHARTLSPGEACRLVLQVLLAPDLAMASYDARGPERVQAAAKLLELDLTTVEAPDPAGAKKATPKGPKGGRR